PRRDRPHAALPAPVLGCAGPESGVRRRLRAPPHRGPPARRLDRRRPDREPVHRSRSPGRAAPAATPQATHLKGLARCISRLGFASRTDAARLIKAGRVTVNGVAARDPERPTDPRAETIALDG